MGRGKHGGFASAIWALNQLLEQGAAACPLAITFVFMTYWEPKLNVGIFCALAFAAPFVR